ncbi:response regulator [Amnibacterium sp.]|uniref:response regulator n=1 Tax=Amnibacterium sp. TaxID=1872496 RepID=UPI003F7BA0F9
MTALSVLVVDDDFRVATVHQGFVERVEGYRVAGVAHTAAEALTLASDLQPDVVLLDLYLPDGDGLSVIRSLLETPLPPVVLVISAATDAEAVRQAVQLGAADYLVKPFGFAALAERLASIREVRLQLDRWPQDATQDDVTRLFELLRPRGSAPITAAHHEHLAPTLRLVRDALAGSGGSLSASEVADAVGISRATAQRYLSRLERTGLVTLELRYGATGRPEHRYALRPR